MDELVDVLYRYIQNPRDAAPCFDISAAELLAILTSPKVPALPTREQLAAVINKVCLSAGNVHRRS
jgi:hypothetical protein